MSANTMEFVEMIGHHTHTQSGTHTHIHTDSQTCSAKREERLRGAKSEHCWSANKAVERLCMIANTMELVEMIDAPHTDSHSGHRSAALGLPLRHAILMAGAFTEVMEGTQPGNGGLGSQGFWIQRRRPGMMGLQGHFTKRFHPASPQLCSILSGR